MVYTDMTAEYLSANLYSTVNYWGHPKFFQGVRLYNGLYSIFIRDWLKVFQQKQVLVVRMEDYHQNITKTMATIFSHLDLSM